MINNNNEQNFEDLTPEEQRKVRLYRIKTLTALLELPFDKELDTLEDCITLLIERAGLYEELEMQNEALFDYKNCLILNVDKNNENLLGAIEKCAEIYLEKAEKSTNKNEQLEYYKNSLNYCEMYVDRDLEAEKKEEIKGQIEELKKSIDLLKNNKRERENTKSSNSEGEENEENNVYNFHSGL